VRLARTADDLGYHRLWVSEHHNMPGLASSATSLYIQHLAANTTNLRVGSGGIMLPNHSPLVIAEQFGLLETLFPGRIDLGLGRAPGTDMATARALRRHMPGVDTFPQDVVELIGYLGTAETGQDVRAFPGQGTRVPVWILGSSLYGARLAAYLGLPYAFASHFAPDALEPAAAIYRETFRRSPELAEPRFMLAVNVFAADADAEGVYLRSSMQQAFINLRTGRPGPLPRPVRDIERNVDPAMLAAVESALSVSATGSPATVRRELERLIARHAPDELILTGQIHDHAARLRSFEIAAEILREPVAA
jgi:luciferase family oxidoreductase group 1